MAYRAIPKTIESIAEAKNISREMNSLSKDSLFEILHIVWIRIRYFRGSMRDLLEIIRMHLKNDLFYPATCLQ